MRNDRAIHHPQAAEAAGDHQRIVQALGEVIRLNPDYEAAYLSLIDYVVSYFPTAANLRALREQVADYAKRHPESSAMAERLRLIDEALLTPEAIGGGAGRQAP